MIFFALFDRREIADACVVHENVDAAEFFLRGLDRRIDLALIGDIELKRQSLSLGGQVFHLGGIACGYNRAVAALDYMLGEFPAEASRAARNKPNGIPGDRRCAICRCHYYLF